MSVCAEPRKVPRLSRMSRQGMPGPSQQLSSPAVSPCGACKFLRRKCTKTCIFAPHFPPDQGQRFANVHKIFGASNVAKLLQELPSQNREDAVNSLSYEADARVNDPIYGCVGALFSLQQQVARLQTELAMAQAELARLHNAAAQNSQRAVGPGLMVGYDGTVSTSNVPANLAGLARPASGLVTGAIGAGGIPTSMMQPGTMMMAGLQQQHAQPMQAQAHPHLQASLQPQAQMHVATLQSQQQMQPQMQQQMQQMAQSSVQSQAPLHVQPLQQQMPAASQSQLQLQPQVQQVLPPATMSMSQHLQMQSQMAQMQAPIMAQAPHLQPKPDNEHQSNSHGQLQLPSPQMQQTSSQVDGHVSSQIVSGSSGEHGIIPDMQGTLQQAVVQEGELQALTSPLLNEQK